MSVPFLDLAGLERLVARPAVQACLEALRAEGEETRLVGGCVRDALLGREVADIDLATTLPPGETLERARNADLKAVPTGFDHGTVTVVVGCALFEVTTLREDIETDGRHAKVRFGRDFARDAERRDFTINALSLDADGRLHDTVGGLTDLAEGRVRFIGDPAARVREDALRILRFFRFHARFGAGEPDRAGLAAAVAARDALDRLSRERVRAEFLKLIVAPRAVGAVATLSETGLLPRIIGSVGELGRLARAARAEASADARLAALAVATVEDAERLRERLRLSGAETARLTAYAAALAALRARAAVDAEAARRLAAAHGPRALRDAALAIEGEPRPDITETARAAWAADSKRPALPIAGRDLVARGVGPGPAVGRGLAAARALWLEEGCPTDEAARERLIAHAVASAAAEAR